MPKTRLKKVSANEARITATTLSKIDILHNNWPEYLRKLGFSDIVVDRYLNEEDSLTPYWVKLKEKQEGCDVGVEKLVQDEVNKHKRNEKIDEILAGNNMKKCIVRNRNRAWFLYDFLNQSAGCDFLRLARLKFRIAKPQIIQIQKDNGGNLVEQQYQLLSTWVRANNLTKLKKIAEALRKLGLVAPEIYNSKSKSGSSSQDTGSSSGDSDSEISSEEISEEEKEICKLKDACKTSLTANIDLQEPVPLQVTQQENVNPEKFGNASSWSFKKQTSKSNITADNIFDEVAQACDKREKSSHETDIKIHQNVVGLSGMAGIGKTTFCKSVFKQWIKSHPESFVFYISSRDLNFENKKKYNVLKFLLASTVHGYEHNLESDKSILKKIENSSDTLIIIDGLDEAKHKEQFSEFPSAVQLCDEKESAYNILMNLLNCHLLPDAKKLIASRPVAFQKFQPECKPSFMAQVLGLIQESQNLLCKELSKTEEQHLLVIEELEKQPIISALCFIPMFAKMIIESFLDKLQSGKPIGSITEVFLNQFEKWQRNPRFCTDVKFLPKLAKLAYEGVQNRQFQFSSKDLDEHDLADKSIEPFMYVHSPQEPGLLILDGESVFFFIHATWQEFLAALHLMVFAPTEELSSIIEELLQKGHWEVVTRFLFGFCQQQAQAKLKVIFTDAQKVEDKERLLKSKFRNCVSNLLSKIPGDYPVSPTEIHNDISSMIYSEEFNSRETDSTLFNICSWAYEAQDDDLTKAVANSLPSLLFLSREILPHEVICFRHVLLAAEEPHMLNVGDWMEAATFLGAGLQILFDTVQQSKHKIKKLHVRENDYLLVYDHVKKLLSDTIELTMENCSTPDSFVDEWGDVFSPTNLCFLDLSHNVLVDVEKTLVKYIHTIPVMRLVGCGLQDDDFTLISKAVAKRATNMKWLNLSKNVMSQNALDCLAPSVYKLDGIALDECSVTGIGLQKLCLEIGNRQKPMNGFSLVGNNIGLIGVNHVSNCVYNLYRLWLDDCNLPGTCLKVLFSAIQKLDHQMELLSIGYNYVSLEIVPMLAKCVHNTQGLALHNCGMNGDGVKIVSNEAKTRDEPMTVMVLSGNKFGDEGAVALAGCMDKVEILCVEDCGITEVGSNALREVSLQWKCKIVGLERQ